MRFSFVALASAVCAAAVQPGAAYSESFAAWHADADDDGLLEEDFDLFVQDDGDVDGVHAVDVEEEDEDGLVFKSTVHGRSGTASATLLSQREALGPLKATALVLDDATHRKRYISLQDNRRNGEAVVYNVVGNVRSVPGSANANVAPGVLLAPSGTKEETTLPKAIADLSNPLYDLNSENQWGVNKLLEKDIFPKYGDHKGAWLCQSTTSWVKLEFAPMRAVETISVLETMNPGGVARVEVFGVDGKSTVVYPLPGPPTASWFVNKARQDSGAVHWALNIPPTDYYIKYVKITIEAMDQWRGIDAVELTGQVDVQGKIPGRLLSNQLAFVPNKSKKYGCDEFDVVARDDTGANSVPTPQKICYGCPKHPKTGEVCSGLGKCAHAACACPKGFEGAACDVVSCPSVAGKMCNGKGVCKDSQCKCFAEWLGKDCSIKTHVRKCYSSNDPHLTTFDGARYSFYETGEWLQYQWRSKPGVSEVVTSHYRKCGNNAVQQGWSPIGCNNGVSFRYGDDVVTLIVDKGIQTINCKHQPDTGGFINVGKHGMQVYFSRGAVKIKTPTPTYVFANANSFHLETNIPTTAANGNDVIGMCGNNDGIKANDITSDIHNALSVPLYPPNRNVAAAERASTRRKRAQAWGNFFKPTAGCELSKCGKCTDTVPSGVFPLKYRGALVLGEESADISEAPTWSTSEHAAAERLLTHLSQSSAAVSEKADVQPGTVGEEAVKAGISLEQLPEHMANCKVHLLKQAMTLGRCLPLIGHAELSDCIWDACGLASKAGGLDEKAAIKMAAANNQQAQAENEDEIQVREELRKELKEKEEKEERMLPKAFGGE